ncbi:hypothetical protein [Staphylococcus phage vB_SauM-V1SA15]|nr:hypothetical protein [Staphylococcus phage vB_SauM-V1SA15]
MNSRQKKILTLTVNNFLILGLDIIALIRYKKGKTKQENYNVGQITRVISTTANSLGILYLEEQERQEKRQKHNESKYLEIGLRELERNTKSNEKIAKDFSHTLNKTKRDKTAKDFSHTLNKTKGDK